MLFYLFLYFLEYSIMKFSTFQLICSPNKCFWSTHQLFQSFVAPNQLFWTLLQRSNSKCDIHSIHPLSVWKKKTKTKKNNPIPIIYLVFTVQSVKKNYSISVLFTFHTPSQLHDNWHYSETKSQHSKNVHGLFVGLCIFCVPVQSLKNGVICQRDLIHEKHPTVFHAQNQGPIMPLKELAFITVSL